MTESEQSLLTKDWTRAVTARELAALMGYIKPLKGAHYDCKLATNEDFGLQEMKIIRVITDLQVYGCWAHVFTGAHAPDYCQGSLSSRLTQRPCCPQEPSKWLSRT